MQLVIADTGPINYLILIGHIDILPRLFEQTLLPIAVQDELAHRSAPQAVRAWITMPPDWLEIVATSQTVIRTAGLQAGETAAIDLALRVHADLLLMDERAGVKIARDQGLRVTGTLGVVDLAAARGLLDFAQAIDRLRKTTFRLPETVLDELLRKHK